MKIEYTFILPARNEEKTLPYCIEEIETFINKNKLKAEILVVDNNSTDNTSNIAKDYGAKVVFCGNIGYGNALNCGIKNAFGKYCIMGDSDGSYNFSNLEKFIYYLKKDYDLIVGNRFKGKIEKGAMPFSHRIGGRMLSIIGNIFFHTKIKDYHCGLRAFKTDSIKKLKLKSSGMEFASEMIISSRLNNLKIIEVETDLRKDLRNRKSHLKTIRDGIRHLKLIFDMAFNREKYIIPEEKIWKKY